MNDDWVARLLADAGTPEMPADVADRLDRALREAIETTGTAPTTDGADTTPTEASSGTSGLAAVPPAAAVPPPAADGSPAAPPLRATMAGSAGSSVAGHPDGDSDTDGPSTAAWGSSHRDGPDEDEVGERRRRRLTRWLPLAAGVLVLGGAGAVAVDLASSGQDAGTTAEVQEQAAAAGAAEAVAPRPLVATGTQYTTADEATFAQQVRDLVAVAGTGASEEVAPEAAPGVATQTRPAAGDAAAGGAADDSGAASEPSAPAEPRAELTGTPLLDQTAFQACVDEVTAGASDTAAAVDLAVVDGLEATVVVVPAPTGEELFVYVVGPDCTGVDGSQFQFITVTP